MLFTYFTHKGDNLDALFVHFGFSHFLAQRDQYLHSVLQSMLEGSNNPGAFDSDNITGFCSVFIFRYMPGDYSVGWLNKSIHVLHHNQSND